MRYYSEADAYAADCQYDRDREDDERDRRDPLPLNAEAEREEIASHAAYVEEMAHRAARVDAEALATAPTEPPPAPRRFVRQPAFGRLSRDLVAPGARYRDLAWADRIERRANGRIDRIDAIAAGHAIEETERVARGSFDSAISFRSPGVMALFFSALVSTEARRGVIEVLRDDARGARWQMTRGTPCPAWRSESSAVRS